MFVFFLILTVSCYYCSAKKFVISLKLETIRSRNMYIKYPIVYIDCVPT